MQVIVTTEVISNVEKEVTIIVVENFKIEEVMINMVVLSNFVGILVKVVHIVIRNYRVGIFRDWGNYVDDYYLRMDVLDVN